MNSRFNGEYGASTNVVLAVIAVIAGCIVLVWGIRAWRATPTGIEHEQVWYYDLNTQELFAASHRLVPPIEAPSGLTPDGELAGVRAYVFSCGDCGDPEQRYIGWVEKYTPEVRRAIRYQTGIAGEDEAAGADLPAPRWDEGHLIRSVENGTDWVQALSRAGQAIQERAMQRCETGAPTQCYP